MLVGIFEKSRRVRTARNSFGLVESDMSSPVARPRVRGLLLGSREQKRMLVKQSLPPGTSVRPFGVTVLVPATPKARLLLPAKHSAGSKLDVSLPHGKLLQKALTRNNSPVKARGVRYFRRRRKRPAGANAPRAHDDLLVQNVGRNAV